MEKIEGQKGGTLHSKEKLKRMSMILYWKARLLKAQGKTHNRMTIENQELCAEIDLNIDEVEIKNNLIKEK